MPLNLAITVRRHATCIFRRCLWLEERGLVRYDRSRTNREYLAQLRGKPTYETFVPVVETFERVWYGKRPLDAEDFNKYETQIAALRTDEERTK